jgi:hypothetical protein
MKSRVLTADHTAPECLAGFACEMTKSSMPPVLAACEAHATTIRAVMQHPQRTWAPVVDQQHLYSNDWYQAHYVVETDL